MPASRPCWESPSSLEEAGVWDTWNGFAPAGFDLSTLDACHQRFGWPSYGLDEHYGFTPPAGLGQDVGEYEMLLRLAYDNQAGFRWGTNWVYRLVPKTDLAWGDLSRVVVTGGNA